MKILVTGGLGYIGIHACVELLNENYQIIILDSLINTNLIALKRLKKITNKKISTVLSVDTDVIFIEGDIRDKEILKTIFKSYSIHSVIHFAGLKSLSESIIKPLTYYSNNVIGSATLFDVMSKNNVKKIIFSSSAMVYGAPKSLPIFEDFSTGEINNPYGKSKYYIENILKDIYSSDSSWKICLLRYFNPVGAHKSGLIGEDPNGVPTNLMPYITQVAARRLKTLKIFGNDYPTSDGTGVRDFIHVVDLARSHIDILNSMDSLNDNFNIFNIGTGRGISVLEVLNAFEKVNKVKVPFKIVDRRKGDIAESWTSSSHVNKTIGWKANYGLEQMCLDAWNWQLKNPNGYKNIIGKKSL
jgi:UDP-glucose 4-epimerase